MPRALRLLLPLLLLAVAGPARAQAALTVYAAASLTEVMPALAAAWTARGHPPVRFVFDASSRLAKQIEAGAPADVFVAADAAWMDHLAGRGAVDAATRVTLATNTLVAVVPAGAPFVPAGPADLARPEVARLAVAGENVPAGRYARAALADRWPTLAPRVVSGDSVRTVLAWVATGEASAGVVYATDARVEPRVRVAFTFPADRHPPVVYPAAVVAGAASPAAARAFLDWCRGDEARATWQAAGFGVTAPAPRSPPP